MRSSVAGSQIERQLIEAEATWNRFQRQRGKGEQESLPKSCDQIHHKEAIVFSAFLCYCDTGIHTQRQQVREFHSSKRGYLSLIVDRETMGQTEWLKHYSRSVIHDPDNFAKCSFAQISQDLVSVLDHITSFVDQVSIFIVFCCYSCLWKPYE